MGTVLVADDSKTIRTICEWVFKGSEHRVVVTSAADEVLHAAETERPDVIVLDYTLPDQDSYEVCRTLKSDARFGTVAVLMLGGTFEEFDEDRATRAGADDTLLKPFRADELAEKVNALTQQVAAGNVARPEGAAAAPPQAAVAEVPRDEATPATPQPAAPPSSRPSRFQFPSRGGSQPAAGAGGGGGAGKRFTFPTAAPRGQAPTPPPQSGPGLAPQRGAQRPSTPAQPAVARHAEPPVAATPSTPSAPAQPASVDPAALRAEIQAAVKEQLPGIVKGILKELITREVTPQLQRWVEEKVTVVAERMLQERLR